MFAGDPTTPDYSRQLTAIAQALSRPSMPVWLVSLISGGLGAAAGIAAEPLKSRFKLWADIRELRRDLRRALLSQEALMHALHRRAEYEQLHAVYILERVSTSGISYLLQYKKELLMREHLYDWVLNVRDLLDQVKVHLANLMAGAEAHKTLEKEQVEVFSRAVHDACYVMWSPFSGSRIKNQRYQRRVERESAGFERFLNAYERGKPPR